MLQVQVSRLCLVDRSTWALVSSEDCDPPPISHQGTTKDQVINHHGVTNKAATVHGHVAYCCVALFHPKPTAGEVQAQVAQVARVWLLPGCLPIQSAGRVHLDSLGCKFPAVVSGETQAAQRRQHLTGGGSLPTAHPRHDPCHQHIFSWHWRI